VNHPVFQALVPVILLIAVGYLSGKRGWIGGAAVRDLSNLVFLVLAPALLFRAMSSVDLEHLEFKPIAIYFAAAILLFFGVLATQGWNRKGTVLALAAIFSNTIMMGIPLITLAYGEAGGVLLLTLISLHAVVLLTLATVVLELLVLREKVEGAPTRHPVHTVLLALRNAVIHPVPLPIIVGLLYAQTGIGIAPIVDKPLQLLGAAFGPMALLLVGVTLSHNPVGPHLKPALALSFAKNFILPVLMGGLGWLLGLRGMQLAVMTVTAALPMGANVFLFSQRYKVAEEQVTAAVAVSSVVGIVSLTLTMAVVSWIG
jgi:malonate transporter